MVRKSIHILLYTLLFSLMAQFAEAQSFTASVSSKEVSQNDNINVTFSASGSFQRLSDLKFPTFDGFQVLSQPQQYQSTSNINGLVSKEYQFTITIRPTANGRFTIQSASVKLDGKLYQTQPIEIQVSGTANKANKSNQSNSEDIASPVSDKDVFVRTIITKSKITKGEAISITQKIYSRKEILNISDIKFPSYEGFLVENIDIGQLKVEVEVLDGIQYYVVVLEKKILFSLKSGRMKLDSPTLKIDIKEIKTRKARNQAEQMWYGPTIRYAEKLSKSVGSSPVYVQVKALPAEPAGFDDLVGSFKLNVSTDKTSTKKNDPITLTIKVEGTGNQHLLSGFDLDLPDDIETYEPKIKQNLSLGSNGFSGSKTFEYLLVPRKAGTFILPSINLIYFDVNNGTYKTLTNDQIQIKVEKGEGDFSGDLPTGLSKKEIELRGKDIQFIKQDLGEFNFAEKRFIGSLIFYLSYVIPLIIFLLILVFYKRFTHFRSNVVLFRQRKASSYSNRKLKKAKKMLASNNKNEFFEEVSNAVYGYLGDKLVISSAELSRERVNEILLERNVNQELVKSLFDLLDECEFARFAPSSSADNLNLTYQNASSLLTKLEKEITK